MVGENSFVIGVFCYRSVWSGWLIVEKMLNRTGDSIAP
jgi:hypothetical protein